MATGSWLRTFWRHCQQELSVVWLISRHCQYRVHYWSLVTNMKRVLNYRSARSFILCPPLPFIFLHSRLFSSPLLLFLFSPFPYLPRVALSLSLLHFAWVADEAKCIVVTRVCVSVCLSAAACRHYCTDPDVTWGSGRGCLLVVHCWANLQSVHGLRCYGNITRTRNVSEYMLVLAVCLVDDVWTEKFVNVENSYTLDRCLRKQLSTTAWDAADVYQS